MAEYVFDLRDPEPPKPWTLEQINAFLAEHEAGKRILACAPDVYERVRAAVESSLLAGYYRVVKQPLLKDGQVLSIDPAALRLPPPEQVIDPEAFKPQYRCPRCLKPTYSLGYCLWCQELAKAAPQSPVALGVITGL